MEYSQQGVRSKEVGPGRHEVYGLEIETQKPKP